MQEEVYEKSIFDEEQMPVRYAGFWERLGALFLDGLILIPLTVINVYNQTTWKSAAILLIVGLAALTYKPLLEYLYGATPGKKALSLAVTNQAYNKPHLKEALLRNIFGIVFGLGGLALSVFIFSDSQFAEVTTIGGYSQLKGQQGYSVAITLLTGFIYIVDAIVLLANKRKRSLHDFIGNTYVIKK